MSHIISSMLQINDSNIDYTDTHVEKRWHKDRYAIFITATLTYTPHACPYCECVGTDHAIVKNGTRQSRITLPHLSGTPAFLQLNKQRFFCKQCRHSFTAKTNIVARHCHISTRVRQWIADQCQHRIPEQYMAEMSSVSTTTVRRVIDDTARSIRSRPTDTLPHHLCFDEFKSVNTVDAAMSFICCDTETHRVIDIIEDRKQSSVMDHFMKFAPEVRRQVQTVTIDMYAPYINVIEKCFPNAKIIIDKFHLVQALNRTMNMQRVQVMNAHRSSDRPLYNKFKRYWKLLLKDPNTLSRTAYKKMPLFKKWQCTYDIVQYLLSHDSTLRKNYEITHGLIHALKHADMNTFSQYLDASRAYHTSKKMRTVLTTFKQYRPYITHTFAHPTLTNGPIEGINNSIKVLKRVAFGYRNFAHFRDRILLMTRLYQKTNHKKDAQSA